MRVVGVIAITLAFAGSARADLSGLLKSQLQQRAATKAAGQEPLGAPIGGFLGSRQSTQQFVTMQAGRCYTILGVSGQGVSDLDLALYNPNGKRVASDIGFDPTPSIQHCAEWPGAYRLEATVKRGAGEVAVQVYVAGGGAAATPPPQATGDGMPPPDPSLQPKAAAPAGAGADALNSHIDGEAKSLAPGAHRVGDFFAGFGDKGQRSDWYVPLEAGQCYTFIAAGGAGVQFLSQYLWDPSGKRVSDNKSKTAQSVMGFCAGIPGPYHLQAKIEKGGGEYHVGVFGKKP
ncbi:MAG: hypothetical protein JWN44_3348 [Myxococcales bacterium]|nr:hypothetical protein [Myxococcales bacterium]